MAEKAINNNSKDVEMTPEQRLAWLRERGVQISTAEERLAGQVDDGGLDDEGSLLEIPFVRVSANPHEPLQQLVFRCRSASLGDQLADHLKQSFASDSNQQVHLDLLPEETRQLLASSSTDSNNNSTPLTVSQDALQKVAAEGNVEVFTLVHPTPANHFVGVNIYLDELGMLKKLPLNARASEYAARAGFNPPPQFYGDVYLGRVVRKATDGGGLSTRHLPFVLGLDTALDSPWLHAAATENLNHQLNMNRITGRDETQPSVVGTDQEAYEGDGAYSWTQTESELEIKITVVTAGDDVSTAAAAAAAAAAPLSSRDVQVQFRPLSVLVKVRNTEVLSLPLFERIDVDSGTWTLEQQQGADRTKNTTVLTLSIEKTETALWPRIRD